MTSGESTSRKSSDRQVWKLSALGVVPRDGTEMRGGIHMNRGRVGEEKGGKETNGCPLTERGCLPGGLVSSRVNMWEGCQR
jgi:hypothetical protein